MIYQTKIYVHFYNKFGISFAYSWLMDLKPAEFRNPPRVVLKEEGLEGRYYIKDDGTSSNLYDRKIKNQFGKDFCLLALGSRTQCYEMQQKLMKPVEWTPEDQLAAQEEGWTIADITGCPESRVFIDENHELRFFKDKDVWLFLLRNPSPLHQKAIDLIHQKCPSEFQKMLMYTLSQN